MRARTRGDLYAASQSVDSSHTAQCGVGRGLLRTNPEWQLVDYEPAVAKRLWRWARSTSSAFRRIIDARLALTLQYHGVTEFATANVRDFKEFGFDRLWNPIAE